MQKELLKQKISAFKGEIQILEGKQYIEVSVEPGSLVNFAKFLRDTDELLFDYLVCLTGVDYPDKLAVVYHLSSSTLRHTIVVKVSTTDRINPTFDTLTEVWSAAEFHEREVFDLFGIKFNNHPDLRRLFLDDDWQGFPLRKNYVDEINIIEL